MAITLYGRQKEILIFLSQYIQRYGFSPTLKEIGDDIGVKSPATVHEHLRVLENKGLIKRHQKGSRGVQLLYKDIEKLGSTELPLLGYIAAGKPLEPYPDTNSILAVSPNLISGKRKAFVLQVKGDSMIEDGILDGDYVIIEEQQSANNGDIVVALLENGFATLKKFYKEATRIRLEPANSRMRPIFAKNVQVQGKVTGIIRRY